ncbi:SDR family oxidoreductase [Streptomyces sp. NPDC045251]|uniref:SDR family oxidoreductase n=1 Tax=Streptomyces sp. NPDC045251 TaxID=3155131 RepID=UPI00340EBD70
MPPARSAAPTPPTSRSGRAWFTALSRSTCCSWPSLFAQQFSVSLMGSVSAYIGHENATVYGAAKAGLLSYTRRLTHELKGRGIRVNGLSPGPTITNAFAPLGPERQAALYEEIRQTVPLHRLGTATELAKAAVYLASDESAYTAGTVLRVDGGIGQLAY